MPLPGAFTGPLCLARSNFMKLSGSYLTNVDFTFDLWFCVICPKYSKIKYIRKLFGQMFCRRKKRPPFPCTRWIWPREEIVFYQKFEKKKHGEKKKFEKKDRNFFICSCPCQIALHFWLAAPNRCFSVGGHSNITSHFFTICLSLSAPVGLVWQILV